jgi:branched-chain amino acid transport system substrate-binding protein
VAVLPARVERATDLTERTDPPAGDGPEAIDIQGGTRAMQQRTRMRALIGGGVVAALATVGLATASGAAVRAADPGVTDKDVTIGYIYPATGVAASISQNGVKAFQARVDRENAAGGVNGRKIEVVAKDDASSAQNVPVTHDLVENEKVFAVVDQSPFAFLSYRYLLDQGVPMVGNGVDGTYYQQKGNEAILSSGGNGTPFGDITYDGPARIMKMAGAKKVGVLAYGAASSSVAAAKALTTYAAPAVGLDPVYTNTSIDFGASDVGAPVLGLKNAGADGVYLPMAAATNVAVAQGLQQNGVQMKAVLMGTGYGQDLLDSPAAKSLPDSTIFLAGFKPVELKDAATKRFQADLKKYADITGVPDYGMYTGYVLADYTIAAMKAAGKDLTRQSFVDAGHGIGQYDAAGLACAPVDVSLGNLGKVPPKSCGYALRLKDGKFQLFPKSGKPITQKLVGSPDALAANKQGLAAPTTTAAPAS